MSIARVEYRKKWFESRIAWRLGLWLSLSLALSLVFFRDFWTSLPTMLSPQWVFGEYRASPWGVLAVCLIFLWLKRQEVWVEMSRNLSLPFILAGLGMVAGAVLMPSSVDYLVFQVLLASVGVFAIIFGSAVKLPAILLAIYGFAISLPVAVQRFAEYAYSRIAIVPVMSLLNALGYPLQSEGQWVHFTSAGGEPISVTVVSGCAGPATMGVFIALFALMMLDMPLPPKKATMLFWLGLGGTWFQSFIRLVIIMLVGYYWGEQALRIAHFWSIYILFPLWFFLFVYLYFQQWRRRPEAEGRQGRIMPVEKEG